MVKCNFLKNKLKTFESIRTTKKKKEKRKKKKEKGKSFEPKGTAHSIHLDQFVCPLKMGHLTNCLVIII